MEEARRLIEIAERKISENDYNEAKQFVNKAQSLYPKLDGLNQVLMIINVYISASSNGTRQEADCYKILGVDPFADEEEVKKQYKKLALSLHPDKNKFNGAEGAFKLVSEAWCKLTDKCKRTCSNGNQNARDGVVDPRAKKARSNKNGFVNSSKQRKGETIWTMCNKCKTQCVYLRDKYLNKAIVCPNCRQTFIATEKPSQQQQQQWSNQNKAPNKSKNTNGDSSSPYVSATSKASQQQWSAQNTSGGTCSKRYSSSPVSFQFNCSMSARSNSGKASNQGQKVSKRRLEESEEVFPFAEKIILKKPRTDVR